MASMISSCSVAGTHARQHAARQPATARRRAALTIHDERPVLHDGLVQRLAREDDEAAALVARTHADAVLRVVVAEHHRVMRRPDFLAALGPELRGALQDVGEGVPALGDGLRQHRAGLQREVEVVGGRLGLHRRLHAQSLAGDDGGHHAAGRHLGDVPRQQLLVARLAQLVLGGEVYPQLQAHVLALLGRHLAVHDAAPGRHPLQVARADGALVSAEVLVQERPFQHVRHRLESAVRVVGEACGRRHLELVQHQERVQVAQLGAL